MKNLKKLLFTFITALIMIATITISNVEATDKMSIEEFLSTQTSVDLENMTEADIITIYEELTDKYTNEELADIVEDYSKDLQRQGISEETINAGTTILRTTDTEQLKQILEEDLDIESIKEKLSKGQDIDEVIDNMEVDTGSVFIKLLLANSIFKAFMTVSIIIGIYMLIIRWLVYKKAGKHGWAAIIPIYRDVVWLKIAGISPWVLLLLLVPIIGWAILAIIMIVSKFTVAESFGRSGWFGLGLWILPIIFESIIAFSSKCEFVEDEE